MVVELTMSPSPNERFSEFRRQMVHLQLRSRGITDVRVLEAMGTVPREAFVPKEYQHLAYEDGPVPIGKGQTISQPLTVAFMCEALRLRGNEKVLEIGTGCGYSAAVLSHLASEVWSVESIASLAKAAQHRFQLLGYHNIYVSIGDGTLGLPSAAPFDAISVTAGGPTLPPPFCEQLAEGGRIVMPIGDSPTSQMMMRFTKNDGQLIQEELGCFAFVPLIGKHGWRGPNTDM
jgi:protein-L-isoaspartate(D-aspartate) O-methyltransferase